MIMEDSILDMAIEIRDKNDDIEAPINDITNCIMDYKNSGLDDNKIKNIVVNSLRSDFCSTYNNIKREPKDQEILLYDIDTNFDLCIYKNT